MGRKVCQNPNCGATGDQVNRTGYCSQGCYECDIAARHDDRQMGCDGICEPMCTECNRLADEAADNRVIDQGY